MRINIDTKRHNNSGDYCVQSQKQLSLIFKSNNIKQFLNKNEVTTLRQVVRKTYDKKKCFYSELLQLPAYFQMQININVYVLTKMETISSISISFSNFNDY